MNTKIKLVITFFALLSLTFSTQAQVKLSLGPFGGLNYNFHSSKDLNETGTGIGAVFASQIDLTFTANRSIGILTSIAFYDNRNAVFTDGYTFNNVNGGPYELGFSFTYLQIEPLFKYRIPNVGLYFILGPAVGFDIGATLTLTEINNNTNNGNLGNNNSNDEQSGDIETAKTRFAIKSGIGFDIPLSRLMTLAPQIAVGIGLTDAMENVDSSILTIQAGIALKFNVVK